MSALTAATNLDDPTSRWWTLLVEGNVGRGSWADKERQQQHLETFLATAEGEGPRG